MSRVPVLLGATAVSLIIIAAIFTLELPKAPVVGNPVTVSKDEVTIFPSGGQFFGSSSLALWNLSVANNSNQPQSVVASLFSEGIALGFMHLTLNMSQTSSQTSCLLGLFPNLHLNFTTSVLASAGPSSTEFNASVQMHTARQIPTVTRFRL